IPHHPEVVTAQRSAQAEHVKGRHHAKVVMTRSKISKSALPALLLWLACATAPATFAAEKVSLIKIDGAIGPATATYISRSIEEARTQSAQCLIIQLNTPGGLLDSTQKIVQSFLGSPVPVIVYVP